MAERRGKPVEFAFLAMTQHKLKNAGEAEAALRSARELMRSRDHSENEENQRVLAEAEKLLEDE